MYLQYQQEGVASSSSSQHRAQGWLSVMPAPRERWSSISVGQEYLAYFNNVNHRYTADVSESVIKSPQMTSTRANHSSLSQVGMPSLGWIKMHPSMKSCPYSSSISSITSINPVSRPQIVENIIIAAKPFVPVASRNAVTWVDQNASTDRFW